MARSYLKVALAVLASAAALSSAADAAAAACNTLPKPTYVVGSSAVQPLVGNLATPLSGTVTLIYQKQGSCTGVAAVVPGASGVTKLTGTGTIWNSDGTTASCDIPADTIADVGASDVFATSCPGVTSVPATVSDTFGPNQVMTFVVPKAASAKSISAEAAFFVFGWGASGEVDSWVDFPTGTTKSGHVFVRNELSGTQQMLSRAIGVPANKWKGWDDGGAGTVLADVIASTAPESTIGILSTGESDGKTASGGSARDGLQELAFQAFGQQCGYLPDSNSTSFDKINVRDGHYPIWGPLHLLTTIDATTKVPTSANAKNLLGYFDGSVALPGTSNLLDVEIAAHTIPACAMKVSRTAELGPMSPASPTKACGCYFDKKANGSTTCSTCTTDGDCTGAAKKCNFGYCEAK